MRLCVETGLCVCVFEETGVWVWTERCVCGVCTCVCIGRNRCVCGWERQNEYGGETGVCLGEKHGFWCMTVCIEMEVCVEGEKGEGVEGQTGQDEGRNRGCRRTHVSVCVHVCVSVCVEKLTWI